MKNRRHRRRGGVSTIHGESNLLSWLSVETRARRRTELTLRRKLTRQFPSETFLTEDLAETPGIPAETPTDCPVGGGRLAERSPSRRPGDGQSISQSAQSIHLGVDEASDVIVIREISWDMEAPTVRTALPSNSPKVVERPVGILCGQSESLIFPAKSRVELFPFVAFLSQ